MIFVTGGTGLIGSHLLYDLTKTGEKVRALKRPISDLSFLRKVFNHYSEEGDKLLGTIEWVEGDILDYFSLEEALEGVDKVYHAAAIVSFHAGDKNAMLDVNANGTANLVNACLEKEVRKLCHVSSIAAIGREKNSGVITEETRWKRSKQNSKYAVSKYGAEREVWRAMAEGLKAVIINPAVVIGPSDYTKGSAEIFYTVWKGLKFYSRGCNGFVDVRDVSNIMIKLMESEIHEERFIISAEILRYKKIFDLIAKSLDKKPPNIPVRPWMAEMVWRGMKFRSFCTGKKPLITKETARTSMQDWKYDNTKIKETLNYEFIPIKECIDNLKDFFMNDIATSD